MASIRRRLTVWYAVALLIAVAAFGAALYFERQRSARTEIDQRLVLEGNLAAQYFVVFRRQLGRTLAPGEAPTLAINAVGGYLDGIRDYVIVFDPDSQPFYRNAAAKVFSVPALSSAYRGIIHDAPNGGDATIAGTGARLRYARVPLPGIWDRPGSILVASPSDAVPFGPGELLQAMLVIAPLILFGGVGLGYVLSDRSLRPLEGMVDELEAITDGRNLHRRLAIPGHADELARLAGTMNRMLARLEESFASLRRFTADASHELKTPLMVLRAGVERAMRNPRTPTAALRSLEEVLEEIHRMSEMVENLLTLARADEGQVVLSVQPLDLRDLVSEAGETAGILGEEGEIAVRLELPHYPVMVPVDRSRIRQLLLNLVTNAIKFTPPKGKVSLGLVDRGETAAIVVGDNGIGMPAADLPHIFDRFYRVDHVRSRTGARPGTGLGLAITRWVAEAHGGTITVQSRLGRGTVFTVTLPKEGSGEVRGTPVPPFEEAAPSIPAPGSASPPGEGPPPA